MSARPTASDIKIGRRIKNERIVKGLSQRSLARKAEISSAYMCQIEKGMRMPNAWIVLKLSHILDVSMEYLLDFKIRQPSPYSKP